MLPRVPRIVYADIIALYAGFAVPHSRLPKDSITLYYAAEMSAMSALLLRRCCHGVATLMMFAMLREG